MEVEVREVSVAWLKDSEPRREHGDIKPLADSIREVGLLNPLTVNQDGRLLAGRRRLEAVRQLGWATVPVRVLQSDSPVFDFKVALEENLKRKNLSDVEVAEALKEYQRLREAEEGRARPGERTDLTSPHCGEVRTQQKTAGEFGISRQAVSKAMKIAEAVEKHPDLRPLQKGSVILQQARRRELLEQAAQPLPARKYRTIYADPPWSFDDQATRAAAATHYPTMRTPDIMALPVAELAADDGAHLYLWATNSHLHDAFHVATAWGFEYKTLLTWVKPQIGLGHYFRNATEHLLFCVRAGLPMVQVGERTWFEAPRQEHSRKPELFYNHIERCSPGPRVELFARQTRPGWEAWGNEVPADVPL